MGAVDQAKQLCCTWDGLAKLKAWVAVVCGALVITVSVISFIEFDLLNCIRAFWNIIFGGLMILLQLKWMKLIKRNFGFLLHWYMRAVFYIFVGTNIWQDNDFFSWCAGFACIFVGVVELIFGCKCHEKIEDEEEEAQNGKPNSNNNNRGNAVEPTITVNFTPQQVAQGAQFAANNAGTVAAVANAAGGAAAKSGDNPFFGNAHLGQQ